MPQLLISPLLILGLLFPVATKAEVYNALCDVSQSTSINYDSSIEVSNCQITLSEEGFSGPTDFIPKDSISQWYSVRQEDNLLLGVAGAAGGTYTGAVVGISVAGIIIFLFALLLIASISNREEGTYAGKDIREILDAQVLDAVDADLLENPFWEEKS